jgi:hypothetical protein
MSIVNLAPGGTNVLLIFLVPGGTNVLLIFLVPGGTILYLNNNLLLIKRLLVLLKDNLTYLCAPKRKLKCK